MKHFYLLSRNNAYHFSIQQGGSAKRMNKGNEMDRKLHSCSYQFPL